MKIGIDISSLQGPHRMRGIGYTMANFLENITGSKDDSFIFFVDEAAAISAEEVLSEFDLTSVEYSVRVFDGSSASKQLPWKFKYISKLLKKFRALSVYRTGDDRYGDISELDAFIQFDQSKPLPAGPRSVKKYFIAYDLIPYILNKDYLVDYHTARQKGLPRRAAFRSGLDRRLYLKKVKLNSRRATHILAISDATKQDYIALCGVDPNKISVITLGVPDMTSTKAQNDGTIQRYEKTSWGYLPRPASLKSQRFLLFVGGADERRRLHDLIAAFNQLKAQGSDIKLVLSGDIMKGPLQIPTALTQKALLHSSYLNDIYFVGFTDDATRNWLYKNALAFVFPSVYEGFGLPVLEAMSLKTPVICYKNRAVEEVAGDIPLYAHDIWSLVDKIKEVETLSGKDSFKKLLEKGAEHTTHYTWQKTAKQVIDIVHRHRS